MRRPLLSFRQSGQLYSITFHWITGHSTFGPCPRDSETHGRRDARSSAISPTPQAEGEMDTSSGTNTHGRTDVSASVPLLRMMTWCFALDDGTWLIVSTTKPWRAFLRADVLQEPWSLCDKVRAFYNVYDSRDRSNKNKNCIIIIHHHVVQHKKINCKNNFNISILVNLRFILGKNKKGVREKRMIIAASSNSGVRAI